MSEHTFGHHVAYADGYLRTESTDGVDVLGTHEMSELSGSVRLRVASLQLMFSCE